MKRSLALLLLAMSAHAAGPPAEDDARYHALIAELRCLVCQNQTIADSNAPLAVDLRNQIRGQISQGRSDDQIRGYMVERYGDFVLYKPPFQATTVVLWLGPPLLIAAGIAVFLVVVRRRRAAPVSDEVSPKRRKELENLLKG